MGSQSELFNRAAQCDRLIKITSDPTKKQIFMQLREMWIALANESENMPGRTLASEIEKIEAIEERIEEDEKKRV